MAFLDFLSGKINCPNCGTEGAKKSGGGYQCPNPHCQWYDSSLNPEGPQRKVMTPGGIPVGVRPLEARSGKSVTISYKNFKGELQVFEVDPESAVRRKNHWSLMVISKGFRVVLSRDRIQNLRDVEAVLPHRVAPGQALPTPRERQVLAYHKKYKSTSPLYETIRAKFPNW